MKFRKSEVILIDEETGRGKAVVGFNHEMAFSARWAQPVISSWFKAMGWTSPDVVPAIEIVPARPPIPEGEWGEVIRKGGFTPTAIAYVGANPTRKVLIFIRPLDGERPIQLFKDRAPGMKLVLDPAPGFGRD